MMKYIISITRCRRFSSDRYIQKFAFELLDLNFETDDATMNIASVLTSLNRRDPLVDVDGNPADEILWECSCLQKKCGACAMVINGRPSLACDVMLKDCRKEEIKIEPLHKFPLIADLMVDRSILYENLKTMRIWLEKEADIADRDRETVYEASECIQCGCCLEVCPNFYAGGNFFGMSTVPLTTKLLSESDLRDMKETAKLYARHTFEGCGKSLACKNVCPKKIDTERLMVNANAMAVWKRKKR